MKTNETWTAGPRAMVPQSQHTHAVRHGDGRVLALCFSEATAKKVAAVPDLLAALKALLPEVEHLEQVEANADDGLGHRLRHLMRLVKQAREAIRAAEPT